MSQCIRNGQGLDVNVLPGHSLLVSSILGSYDATQITGTGGTGLALATASTGGATYGPYASGATIRLRASADGVIEYDSALVPAMLNNIPAFLATDISGNVTGLVSGDGIISTPRILGQGLDIAGSRTITGSTAETSVYQLVIPAGALGPSGSLRISTLFGYTNNANVKTVRVKFGNSSPMVLSGTPASTASTASMITIQNMGSESAQEAFGSVAGPFGGSVLALVTSAIDTAIEQLLEITLQLAVGTDSASLRRVLVELIRP